jgi:DNA protecting protein DprA
LDQVLFYAQLLLSDRERVRFVRHWLDHRCADPEVVDLLLERHGESVLRRHYEHLALRCEELSIERVDLLDESLPRSRVDPLVDPPGILFLRGNRDLLRARRSIGVVGARRGTERGRRTARTLGGVLGRAGAVVVSGLALGIDGASHEGCLETGGKPMAWLACGVETVTPASHRGLYRRVRERGLLASEYPPDTPVRRPYFVARNRLIAAFSDALVVVEAGERSGTRSTVDFTLQLGRDLYCVPGPVDCPHSSGTLQWIRDGARMIRGGRDLLEDLGWRHLPSEPSDVLGLGERPESTMEIVRRTGLLLPQVAVTLARAEARGEVRRLAGDRWCRACSLPG